MLMKFDQFGQNTCFLSQILLLSFGIFYTEHSGNTQMYVT